MQRFRVLVSLQAKQSLKNIVQHISAESPTAARFVRIALIELIESLEKSPEKFSREPLLAHKRGNYRSVVKWHYKIIYRVKRREVVVLDIIHTSRNPRVIRRIK